MRNFMELQREHIANHQRHHSSIRIFFCMRLNLFNTAQLFKECVHYCLHKGRAMNHDM